SFAERWHGHEDELVSSPQAVDDFRAAKSAGDFDRANIYAGQSVGALHAIESAAEIVARLEMQAEAALEAILDVVRRA
ncbi:MAG: putative 2-nitropropane dioxygenase, partial [Candidatus Eremiobacteraeota bacterium]|nr:putative 2-nitropropane dioxygenase [Candidatus Eremiobacteraeota bacterium]